MGKFTALVGFAALAGVGFYVGKKLIEKRNAEEEERAQHIYEDDSELFVEEKHSTPKEKLQKASMFAVGAIKTGTEKFKEGIDDIINNDMVSKGEETFAKTKETAAEAKDKAVNFAKDAKEKTVDFAKNAGENIKEGIDNIKSKVTQQAEDAGDAGAELADAIKKDVDDLTDKAVDMAEEMAKDPNAIVEQVRNEHQHIVDEVAEAAEKELEAAADDINNISNLENESVETFDFSKPEQL